MALDDPSRHEEFDRDYQRGQSLLAGFRSTETLLERIGPYRVIRLCGGGSSGSVYEAIDERTNASVAVKVLTAGAMADRRQRQRFRHEIELHQTLSHPGIAKLIEAGEFTPAGGRSLPYLTMELVDGVPIDEYAKTLKLGVTAIVDLMIRVSRAVGYSHSKHIAHRDLKPANILVTPAGETKVVDFGLARDLVAGGSTLHTLHQVALGTAAFMSPEQARGDHELVDARSDVYALGVILFKLLTGRLPVEVDGLAEHFQIARIADDEWASVIGPPSCFEESDLRLDAIVGKCLARRPGDRYLTGDQLADELEAYQERRRLTVRIPGPIERASRFVRRYRWLVAITSTLATVLVGTIVLLWLWMSAAREAEAIARRAEHAATQAAAALQASESKARRQLADSYIDKAWTRFDQGEAGEALLWIVEAMKLDQADDALMRLHRLRFAGIARHAPKLLERKALTERDHNQVAPNLAVSLQRAKEPEGNVTTVNVELNGRTLPPIRRPLSAFTVTATADGSLIAVGFEQGSNEGRIDVMRTDSGEIVWSKPVRSAVKQLAFSRDGRYLAAACWHTPSGAAPNGAVLMFSSSTSEQQVELSNPNPAQCTAVAFTAEDTQIVMGDFQGSAHVWNWAKRELVGKPLQADSTIYAIASEPDGSHVFLGTWAGGVRAYEVATGKPASPIIRAGDAVGAIAIDTADSLIITTEKHKSKWRWRPEPYPASPVQITGSSPSAFLNRDGSLVAWRAMDGGQSGGSPAPAFLGNLATGQVTPLSDACIADTIFADRDRLVVVEAGLIRLLDAAANTELARINRQPPPENNLTWTAVHPHRDVCAWTEGDGSLHIFGTGVSGEEQKDVLPEHVAGIRFTPDGRLLLVWTKQNPAQLIAIDWALRVPKWSLQLDGRIPAPSAVAIGSDSSTAFVMTMADKGHFVDIATGTRIGESVTFRSWPAGAVFVGTTNRVVAIESGGWMTVFEKGSPEPVIGPWPVLPNGNVWLLADQRTALARSNTQFEGWDIASGRRVLPTGTFPSLLAPSSRMGITIAVDNAGRGSLLEPQSYLGNLDALQQFAQEAAQATIRPWGVLARLDSDRAR